MLQRLAQEPARERLWDAAFNSSAVPSATMYPPSRPAPGPRSMTCSARRIVSSSCSTTTTRVALARSGARACRATSSCRADAGRWSARRGCSRRRAGSSRAARPAGCVALRRRSASARRGRATGSQPDLLEERQPRSSSARMSRAISPSRPRSFILANTSAAPRDRAGRRKSAMVLPRNRTATRFAVQAAAVRSAGRLPAARTIRSTNEPYLRRSSCAHRQFTRRAVSPVP